MAMLFAFAGLLLAVLLAVHLIKGAINALAAPTTHGQAAAPTHVRVPMPSQPRSQRPAPVEYPTAPAPPRRPTEAEIRESQRKADEAMKIIEATTPEV